VILPEGRRGQVPGLADSKLLTPAARERVYAEVLDRALAWSAVVIPAPEVDCTGLHVSNVVGMRRALARLQPSPAYVLTDGFPVAGLAVPGLAVWKGDQVAACIAAASVVAKVTRDRIMTALHDRFPQYEFATHKGYVTADHQSALELHGPCPEHRFSYVNVVRARDGVAVRDNALLTGPEPPDASHLEIAMSEWDDEHRDELDDGLDTGRGETFRERDQGCA
jgi:ribonuclease HII